MDTIKLSKYITAEFFFLVDFGVGLFFLHSNLSRDEELRWLESLAGGGDRMDRNSPVFYSISFILDPLPKNNDTFLLSKCRPKLLDV